MVTALDLTWEAASHLLRHTRGKLTAAFKDELSAYHLNEKLLDQLVWEYAAHRYCYFILQQLSCLPREWSLWQLVLTT